MTCATLNVLEDLKVPIREKISKIYPPGNVPHEYEELLLRMALGELGTLGHYLMVGLSTLSGTQMRLKDVLLHQPNSL